MTTATDLNDLLVDQIDWHWRNLLRPRLEGLSDEEYFWEPVPECWSVRPRGTGSAPVQAGSGDFTVDFAFPEPDPPPVTTIAWRLAHVIVGILAIRNAGHFGRTATDYGSFEYAGAANEALAQLDQEYAHWIEGVRALDAEGLQRPCGPAEDPWGDRPMAALVLHINRELIHHGAEIALLRDLYAHQPA
jgi:DinB superfamily